MQPAGSAKAYRQLSAKLSRKNTRRRVVRYGLIGFNVVLLSAASVFVLQTTHTSQASTAAASLTQTDSIAPVSPLDQISSANIAATVAQVSSLPETAAVTNQADSESTELTMTTTSSVVAKPQVVGTKSPSKKDIFTYTTQAGDSVASLAQKFSVTSDTIRWSNNLKGDVLKPGINLVIPPVSGIVYTVQVGDTADTLARKYNVSKDQIIGANDAESTGIKVGERILIPGGTKAAVVVRNAVFTGSFSFHGVAAYGYNGYDYGYCTWWVAHLRAQAGNPVPSNLGNASTWAIRAAGMGLPVGSTPRVGAAVVTSTRGAGHVAYVTAVHSDGTITVSEMNHEGWNRVDTRTIPTASNFRYIY